MLRRKAIILGIVGTFALIASAYLISRGANFTGGEAPTTCTVQRDCQKVRCVNSIWV